MINREKKERNKVENLQDNTDRAALSWPINRIEDRVSGKYHNNSMKYLCICNCLTVTSWNLIK